MLPNLDFRKTGIWLLILWGLALPLFRLFPGIDLWVSGRFWLGPEGGFRWVPVLPLEILRNALWDLEILVFLISLVAWGLSLVKRKAVLGLPGRAWGFVATLFLLGPALVVNVLFKAHSGRPRPANVTDFGGPDRFVPAWDFSGACTKNCSFVSGEVASAVALGVALWLASALWRGMSAGERRGLRGLAVAIPLFVAFQRIVTGRHFLSDATFATLMVLTLAWGLYALFRGAFRPVQSPPEA